MWAVYSVNIFPGLFSDGDRIEITTKMTHILQSWFLYLTSLLFTAPLSALIQSSQWGSQ